jgi:aldehyde dehydrogenase (NAD+)
MNLDPKKFQTKLLINNEWVNSTSGKTYPVINPATGEKIVDIQLSGPEDVEKAVRAARKAFETWGKSNPRDRARLLNRLADLIEQNKDELGRLETLNTGKPLKTHTMKADVPQTISTYRYYAGWADKLEGKTIPVEGNYFAYTRYDPVGVCGQIIPWNWPLMMQAWKFGPALAAGCTVVLKPSQFTPLTALRIGELIIEAGFPPGVVNILPGEGAEIGNVIARHMNVDKVAFTGSTDVGKMIEKAAAESNLKRVSLELGGNGPNIIFADADFEQAVQTAIHGVFFNMGQNCSAVARVYVEEPIYDAFIQRATELVQKRKVGDPFADDTEQGPATTQKQFDKIMKYIKAGQDEGARLVTGGKRIGNKGFFIEPTIFADVKDDMKIAKEEIFGPVMVMLKFKDINDVIDRANNSIYGLTAGVSSKDITKALSVAHNVKSGTVWVNTWNQFDTAVPFGGYRQSGIGRELGPYGLMNYLEVHSVYISLTKATEYLDPKHAPIMASQ